MKIINIICNIYKLKEKYHHMNILMDMETLVQLKTILTLKTHPVSL